MLTAQGRDNETVRTLGRDFDSMVGCLMIDLRYYCGGISLAVVL